MCHRVPVDDQGVVHPRLGHEPAGAVWRILRAHRQIGLHHLAEVVPHDEAKDGAVAPDERGVGVAAEADPDLLRLAIIGVRLVAILSCHAEQRLPGARDRLVRAVVVREPERDGEGTCAPSSDAERTTATAKGRSGAAPSIAKSPTSRSMAKLLDGSST